MSEQMHGCLICGARLVYFTQAEPMSCALCGQTQHSLSMCENGHYVCDACHQKGAASIVPALCQSMHGTNPLTIAESIMRHPSVHIHGPEHHYIAGAALLCAYHHITGDIDLTAALDELIARGCAVPGGTCGYWGACGAAISTGVYISVLTGATPYSIEPWRLCNAITAQCLQTLADVGGPRCCKRMTYLCIVEAAKFTAEHFGVTMPLQNDFHCIFHRQNAECIRNYCPFYPE